MLTEKFSEV